VAGAEAPGANYGVKRRQLTRAAAAGGISAQGQGARLRRRQRGPRGRGLLGSDVLHHRRQGRPPADSRQQQHCLARLIDQASLLPLAAQLTPASCLVGRVWCCRGHHSRPSSAGEPKAPRKSNAGATSCQRTNFGRENFHPHNILISVLGAALLWVGWLGFNGCLALSLFVRCPLPFPPAFARNEVAGARGGDRAVGRGGVA